MATLPIPQQTIPGPHALPLLGWWLNMLKIFSGSPTYLQQLHEKYGNVVALAKGDPSHLVVFGPEMNLRVLSNPDLFEVTTNAIMKIPNDTPLGRLSANGLLTMNGEKHKQHRRIMQPSFHKQQIALYHQDMVTLTQQMLDQWQGQTQIDVHRAMQDLTQHIAMKTLFGLSNKRDSLRIGKMMEQLIVLQRWVVLAPLSSSLQGTTQPPTRSPGRFSCSISILKSVLTSSMSWTVHYTERPRCLSSFRAYHSSMAL